MTDSFDDAKHGAAEREMRRYFAQEAADRETAIKKPATVPATPATPTTATFNDAAPAEKPQGFFTRLAYKAADTVNKAIEKLQID